MDGFVTTGQGFLSYNMFTYCLNNPVNCTDPTGSATKPMWEQLGFRYNGTMGDYRRLEEGLPPIEYVNWLKSIQKIETDITQIQVEDVSIVATDITYIPANDVEPMHEKMVNDIVGIGKYDDAIYILGVAAGLVISEPMLVTCMLIYDNAKYSGEHHQKIKIAAFKNAMENGEAVLIVKWEIQGDPTAYRTWTNYYSWDGYTCPFDIIE